LGTNAIATAQMLKAKANRGATGENAIVQTVRQADLIVGALSVVLAHAMMGEVTPAIAEAISASPAPKFLLPLCQENTTVIGSSSDPLPHLVEELVDKHIKSIIMELEPK